MPPHIDPEDRWSWVFPVAALLYVALMIGLIIARWVGLDEGVL
jgi:hypothetical protein